MLGLFADDLDGLRRRYEAEKDRPPLERGSTVLWRKKDLEQLRDDLIHVGYGIDDFCWHAGNDQLDYAPNVPPYQGHDHIKLTIGNHVCTSVGWISTKPK